MKSLLSVAFLVLVAAAVHAQTYSDVLRYSYFAPQGSARFAATGGSLTPLGVDVTTLHTNPAGIGWNRYNVAQITPGFTLTNSGAEVVGSTEGGRLSDAAANFTLPSAGVVLAGTTRSVNWSTLNFGISLTRMGEFNQNLNFSGRTPGGIIEGFAEDINNGLSDPYASDLAPDEYFFIEDGIYYTDFYDFTTGAPRPDPILRNGTYDRRGGMSEVALGLGGNYREKVLWGLSLGIPFFSFDENYTYEELDDERVIPNFENATWTQNLSNSGTGFNLKFGIIALPTEKLRVSAAIHTPTFWSIDEQYNTAFGYTYNNEDGIPVGSDQVSPFGAYSYNLRTPWRFNAGLGALLGRRGFVSVDADYVNYTGNSASFDDFSTANDVLNGEIDALLSSALGVRVGGELNLDPIQVRAGVGYRQMPFAEYANGEDHGVLTYSAGAGYSLGKFFVDLAAQVENYNSFNVPFRTFDTVLTDRTRVSVLLSVGFRGFGTGF